MRCAKYFIVLSIIFTMRLLVIPGNSAAFLNENLGLLSHNGQFLQPCWSEDSAFSTILAQDVSSAHEEDVVEQTDFTIKNIFQKVKTKLQISFSPTVIIKPFVIVEELQALLVVYNSGKIRKAVPIDENFQVELLFLSKTISKIEKVIRKRSNRSLSLSPYYNRIYGLHLEIRW